MHAEADTDALTALYTRNVDAVYRICYVYLRSRADTEDAVPSVFLRYLQKQPVFRDENHERGWLLLTAKNICRDMLRSWWRRHRAGLDELPEPAVPMRDEEPSELTESLLALPEKNRITLYLYYWEGYPAREVAALLGCRESTVRTRLQRGREMPKNDLGGSCHETGSFGQA